MTRFLAAALLFVATSAQATPRNCYPRDVVVKRLATGYGEARQAIGLNANGSILEIFASAKTGTWTVVITLPNGIMCLMASGENFEWVTDPKGDPT